MAQIPNLQSTNTLGIDDQAILRQGTIDKRISLNLAGILSWAKRNGYTHIGEHTTGIQFLDTESFTTFQGKTYFVKSGVVLPYTATSNDPVTDYNLYSKGEYSLKSEIYSTVSNTNLLSNHNFLAPSPLVVDGTPQDASSGVEIFSGVFAGSSGIQGLTYIDGHVSFTAGDFYMPIANTGAIARLTPAQLTASVADFDGKPRTRGVSFDLVGDEYRVTVGVDALEDVSANPTPLGSVKFEQGSVATRHETESLSSRNLSDYTDIAYKASGGKSAVENMIEEFSTDPLSYAIGTILKTGGTTWRYEDSTGPITVDNFRAFNVLNAIDCGATGESSVDDTAALDYAAGLANSTGMSLFLPKGHYIYNGVGLGTEDYVQIIGEGSGTIIDAGANTNSGFLFTMGNGVGGRRTRLRRLELRGNPNNPSLRGVNFTLTQEDSGADELVFQDWHYGLELNRLFYCHFSDISFRNSQGVTLTGSHLNIGDSDNLAEVNNIEFSKIHFLGSQDACVTVNCYTQTLTYNSCSFETTGTRFKFVTDRLPNTTTLNRCYIEGTSTENAIIASSENKLIKLSLNDCLIRVDGNNSSVMFDNVHGFLEACHGGSPNVLLASATGRVTYVGDNTISTRDNFFVLQGGSWNNSTEETNFERFSATPKRLGAQEFNAIIPKFVHQKTVNQGVSEQAIFAIYLPADGSNQRKIRLDLNVTLQATGATPNVGQDKWTLLFYKGGGVGDGSTSGHQALLVSQGGNYVNPNTVKLTQLGYNSVTDSTKYLVSYSPTTDVYDIECFFEIEGTFHNSSSEPERSWPWRIEKI